MNENDFEIKQYRIEWVVEVYALDQYGRRNTNIAPTYSRGWATREQAQIDVEAISVPHEYVEGRRVTKSAHSHYHDVGIFYREVLIDNPTDTKPTTPEGWRLVPVVPTSKQICHMAMRITGADEDGWYRTDKGDWPECVEKAEQAYQQALENAPKFGEEE